MAFSECPECAFHLTRNPAWKEGSLTDCPDCGARLVVESVEPLILELAQE